MKNLKKVLALVVVFAMMLTFAVSASPFPDVPDSASYAEAATVLNGIGIMIGDEKGNFNPDKTITRAEAATIVVRMKNLGDAAAGAVGATAFTDVPASHWASGFVNIATQSGIVDGYGDGTFGPEDPVTYEQMVKLIVAALGYTPKANANGGYPTGYLVIASQEGITKGATGNAGEPAPRKTVARLVYNALDVNLMEQTAFGTGNEEFGKSDDTLLDLLGIEKVEGVVTATPATKGQKSTEDPAVDIDGYDDELLVGDTDAAGLLGYKVVAYVDTKADDPTILAIAQKSGKNNTIELDYSQLDKVNKDGGEVAEVKYFENPTDKSAEKITMADDVEYFYNGKANSTSKADAIEFLDQVNDNEVIKPGKVKFVDNDGDDNYDIIFVTEYNKSYVVDEVNESRQTITDKRNNDVNEIDMDDESVIYTFYKDGQLASFDDIEEDNTITLAISSDGKFVTVYISDAIVEGTVAEKTSDIDEYYRIDGKLYRLDIDGTYSIGLKVGDEGKYYLNVDNRVVYKEASSNNASAGSYAFLYDAKISDDLGSTKMQIRYLTADGKFENAYLANKITVYKGNESDNAVDPVNFDPNKPLIENLYEVYYGDVYVNRDLFKYTKNSAGEINKIYIWAENDDDNFSQDTLNGGEYSYKAATDKIGNVFLDGKAVVFSVPEDVYAPNVDEDDFKVTTTKAIFSDGDDYVVRSFDEGDEGYPAALVVYGAESEIDVTTRLFVLTSVASGNNANGVTVDKFYGYQEGKSVSAEASEDGIEYYGPQGEELDFVPELEAGDAIIFSLDADGNIDKIQVLMKAAWAKQDTAEGFIYEDALDDDGYTFNYFGRAIKKNTNNRLDVDCGAYGEETLPLKGNDYSVYEVNVNRNTAVVNTSSYSAIDANATMKDGKAVDWVFVRMYDNAPVDVVIYTYTYDADLDM